MSKAAAKGKAPKAQKMVANDEGQPSSKASHHAKVNMHLPTGQELKAGEAIALSRASHKHLKDSFGDSLHHIVEPVGDVHEEADPGAPADWPAVNEVPKDDGDAQ